MIKFFTAILRSQSILIMGRVRPRRTRRLEATVLNALFNFVASSFLLRLYTFDLAMWRRVKVPSPLTFIYEVLIGTKNRYDASFLG